MFCYFLNKKLILKSLQIMEHLPNEIIEHIYTFLSYSDKLLATEICLRWHAIFIDRLIKQTMLRIKEIDIQARMMSFEFVMQLFAKSDRCYLHLTLDGVDFTCTNQNTEIHTTVMLANQGLHVQTLSLINCRIPMQKLYQIMHMMSHVRALTMTRCYITLCDEFWCIPFEPQFDNLESIALQNIWSKNEDQILELLLRGNSAKVDLTMDDDSIDDRTQIINTFASRISHLSFVYYQSNTLRNVFSENEMSLESLRLKRQPHDVLHSLIILEIIPSQRSLKQLYINTLISPEVLKTIAETCTGLTYLSVTIDSKYDSLPVNIFWPKLQVLYLSCQTNLELLFNEMRFNGLIELHLYTERLLKPTIAHIYDQCCQLKKLSLSALSMVRCDAFFSQMNLYLTKLQSLAVQCSSRTTFVPLLQSIQLLPQLSSLSIVFCEKINDQSVGCINLPQLRSFIITRNRKVSTPGFKLLFANCPRIESLTIRECPMFGDETVEAIVKSLPNLKSLDVSKSSGITLNSIRLIITCLTSLTILRIDDCPRILKQWRNASYYINNLLFLRSFYCKYPEFFHYDLPSDLIMQYQNDDDCFDYDSSNDASDSDDLDGLEKQLIALNDHVVDAGNEIVPDGIENADVIIISDDDD